MNTTIVPFFLYIWPLSVAYMLHASRHSYAHTFTGVSIVIICSLVLPLVLALVVLLGLVASGIILSSKPTSIQETNKVLIAYHGDTTYLVEVNYHVSLHQDPHFKETFHLMCLGRGEFAA